jgi:hypothetical protein
MRNMSPVANNPVIVPDRELQEERTPSESEPPASAVRAAAGPAKKTTGYAVRS